MSVDTSTLLVESMTLHCPPLQEVADGLGGQSFLIESGSVSNLLSSEKIKRIYNIKEFGKAAGLDSFLMLGATGGAHFASEMIVNMSVDGDKVDNQSRIARSNRKEKRFTLDTLPDTETEHAVAANLFCTEGKPGKVLKVHCQHRVGDDDFVTAIRKTLEAYYEELPVGLGGTFLLKAGKARQHITSDLVDSPIATVEDINKWLDFFDMSAPLIAVGTLISADPGLDLRAQHFHTFSHHGEGGHYDYDITPGTVEYLGYFGLAQNVVRIDRPLETQLVGSS